MRQPQVDTRTSCGAGSPTQQDGLRHCLRHGLARSCAMCGPMSSRTSCASFAAVAREVNMRIHDLAAAWELENDEFSFLCECGDRRCTEMVSPDRIGLPCRPEFGGRRVTKPSPVFAAAATGSRVGRFRTSASGHRAGDALVSVLDLRISRQQRITETRPCQER